MFSERYAKALNEVRNGLQSRPSLDWSNPISVVANYNNLEIRSEAISRATNARRKNWQNQLFLMPPYYISDDCADSCLYCPYQKGLVPTEFLSTLNPQEVQIGVKDLLAKGYEDVELVSATNPKLLKGEIASEYVQAAKDAGVNHLGINFMPGSNEEYYRKVADAGTDYVIVWQETYNREVYTRMHPRGPKANMKYRLDAHDRAALGGIRTFGGGFLGRLPGTDWREESLMVLSHMGYLSETYKGQIIFGMPRWIPTPDVALKESPSLYDDQSYQFVGALYSLFIPQGLVWFSTREEFGLSAKAAEGGGCLFTLDCSTEVDGYKRKGYAQFPVYSMDITTGIPWLQNQGYNPTTSLPWI